MEQSLKHLEREIVERLEAKSFLAAGMSKCVLSNDAFSIIREAFSAHERTAVVAGGMDEGRIENAAKAVEMQLGVHEAVLTDSITLQKLQAKRCARAALEAEDRLRASRVSPPSSEVTKD